MPPEACTGDATRSAEDDPDPTPTVSAPPRPDSLQPDEPQIPELVRGQCQFYIKRKRRFCSSRAADPCSKLCSAHQPESLRRLRQESAAGHALKRRQQAKEQQDQAQQQRADHAESVEATGAAGPIGSGSGESITGKRKKRNMGRTPKRMANPLAAPYQVPVSAPGWDKLFSDVSRPLLLDIGCARGRWLLELAIKQKERHEQHGRQEYLQRDPQNVIEAMLPHGYNYCGVELYAPLVAEANRAAHSAGIGCSSLPGADVDGETGHASSDDAPSSASAAYMQSDDGGERRGSLYYIAANINVSIHSLQLPMPKSGQSLLCLQFPDPWDAHKHGKRRVMSSGFAKELAAVMHEGALFYFSSDHRDLCVEALTCLLANKDFEPAPLVVAKGLAASFGVDIGEAQPDPAGYGQDGLAAQPPPAQPLRRRTAGIKLTKADTDVAGVAEVGAAQNSSNVLTAEELALGGWLARNPFGVPTERERVCELLWRPVWRFLVRRTNQ